MWALFSQLFMNPAFLFGTAAAAIPVVLHLAYRRTAIELPFPSLKLLRLSTRRVARRKKIEELLLLIVRMALLFFLALALAKPFLKVSGPLASRSETAVALVFDNSGSMAASAGGTRRIDQARAEAVQVLDGLGGEGAQGGLFLAAEADEKQPGQTLTHRLEDVRTALGKTEPSLRRTELSAALKRALEALDRSAAPNRELYLFTDLQSHGLREALEDLKDRPKSRQLSALLVPVLPRALNDQAVVELKAAGRGLLVQTPLTLEATVKNLSEEAAEAQAELYLDGERQAARRVPLAAGAAATVGFPVQFQSPGVKSAAVQLSGDDNPLNDRRVLALPIEDALRVLLVEGAGSVLEAQNASYYVARALDPFESAAGGARSGIRPLKLPEAGLLTEELSHYQVVFLLNPGSLSLAALHRLKDYVRQGGGLVVFPGPATDGPRLTQDLGLSLGSASDGILPAKLGPRFGTPVSEERVFTETPVARVEDLAFSSPILAPFKGLDRTLFTSIQVHAGFELSVPAGGAAETLLLLDGQRPLLAGAPSGAGECYLFAVAPTPDWTNLPVAKGSVFLPLLHTLCHQLASRRTRSGSLTVGRNLLRGPKPQKQSAKLAAPDGKESDLAADKEAPLVAQLDRPGVWRLRFPDPAEPPQVFSVNADAAEASAERLSPAEVKETLARVAAEVQIAEDPVALEAVVRRIREGVPLWSFFLVIVLLLAALEIFLGGRVRNLNPVGGAPPENQSPARGATVWVAEETGKS